MSAPLVLSSEDQRRLLAAATALVSMLAYPDLDAWRRAVCTRVRELFGADRLIFVLPRNGTADPFSEEYDPTEMARYPEQIQTVEERFYLFERLRAIGAGTRPMLYDNMDAFYQSPYWNEYAQPNGALDSLTMSVPVSPSPMLAHHAQLLANHDTLHAVPFGDHEVGMARLLLPALQTGALAWQRLAGARDAFASLVDTLAVGVLVFDMEGRERHRNPVAARLLETGPPEAAAMGSQMAQTLAGRSVSPCSSMSPGGVVSVGHLVLRAALLSPDIAGRNDLILVTVEWAAGSTGSPLPDAGSVRERLGLTHQQARVALLLAARRSTAEIADALSISIHTVRRHTESVLERLGVTSRTEVERVVRGASC